MNALFEAYSFVCPNVPFIVQEYQKRIFDKFNLPIIQIREDISHGAFLNKTIKNSTAKYVIFFDVDCIPLTEHLYDIIIKELEAEKCIIGAEQMCNYNYEKRGTGHIYAAPACIGIPTSLYKELGEPTLEPIGPFRSDTAEELTWACEQNNIKVKLFNITCSENIVWRLDEHRNFGHGSTYSHLGKDVLYHQFEIRMTNELFIKKCNFLLDDI